ncbi:hypothetical protein [Aeromonas salmonicida]|uniref:hypothetical protein n=1 Tax=Aeromonas salmonicida TaxID=645 RepID=UPI001F37E12E|nr:hypothetical protein [Aeromonas salmonicida]MCE9932777.1 hypothetical protein [Aeromonas salmonicida]
MQQRNRLKLSVAIVTLTLFAVWAWWFISVAALKPYFALQAGEGVVKIAVHTLWAPVGLIGVLLVLLVTSPICLIRGVLMSDVLTGLRMKAANILMVCFLVAGVMSGFLGYQKLQSDLVSTGYTYCKALSKTTPSGKYVAYVRTPDLCIKKAVK